MTLLPPLPRLELDPDPLSAPAVARLADDGRAILLDAAAPLRLKDAVKERRLAPEQGRRIVHRLIGDARSLVRAATDALVAGGLRLGSWFRAMRDAILPRHFAASFAVLDHPDPPPADIDAIAAESDRQVGFLARFRGQLATAEQLLPGAPARAGLYAHAIWSISQSVARAKATRDGFKFERNQLGIADSCFDCLTQTALGWVPIGSLIPIGSRLCHVNCKCSLLFK
jgi:hypothetical protein